MNCRFMLTFFSYLKSCKFFALIKLHLLKFQFNPDCNAMYDIPLVMVFGWSDKFYE